MSQIGKKQRRRKKSRSKNTSFMAQEARQISDLERQVLFLYDHVDRNVKYTSSYGVGEIDMIGYYTDGTVDIYEVKTSPRYTKARQQLVRAFCCSPYKGRINDMLLYIASTDQIFLMDADQNYIYNKMRSINQRYKAPAYHKPLPKK